MVIKSTCFKYTNKIYLQAIFIFEIDNYYLTNILSSTLSLFDFLRKRYWCEDFLAVLFDLLCLVKLNILILVFYCRYNNKTYRIDDIAWDKSPESKFEYYNGEEMSYIEYYRYHTQKAYSFSFSSNLLKWFIDTLQYFVLL